MKAVQNYWNQDWDTVAVPELEGEGEGAPELSPVHYRHVGIFLPNTKRIILNSKDIARRSSLRRIEIYNLRNRRTMGAGATEGHLEGNHSPVQPYVD